MARFPRIDSPCPYKDDRAAMFVGNFCRMCKREVVDLTTWSDDERARFLASCEGEVCVSYRRPSRPALVAATMAAAVAALPAAAQDVPAGEEHRAVEAPEVIFLPEERVWMGRIKDPRHTALTEDDDDDAPPELPVVYEPSTVDTEPAAPVSGSAPRRSTPRPAGWRAGSRR